MKPAKESMEKIHGKEKALAKLLFGVFEDYEFVFGVLADLKSDDERQTVINEIVKNPEITSEEIILTSLTIASESR